MMLRRRGGGLPLPFGAVDDTVYYRAVARSRRAAARISASSERRDGSRRRDLFHRIFDGADRTGAGARTARLRFAVGGRALAHPGQPPLQPAGWHGADPAILR